MPRRFGSDRSPFQNQALTITDAAGITLLDTSNNYGASPLGNALREQAAFGLPNATFNLLPPDPASPISDYENGLPYWSLQTTNNITATPLYDTTTQTWGIKIDPGTAPSGDYLTLKTRSWVTTDDNLALRQKASLTLAKNGTYSGTTQWNLTLSAEYFDATNTSVGSAAIGTVYDNTTWTSISGTTTVGGSAIPTSAAWAEFTIKLTATQNITSSTSATIKSLLLATSTPASGGAFVIADEFTASGTWVKPTGVNYVTVAAVGGGGGGASGGIRADTAGNNPQANAGQGGGSSPFVVIRDVYVGAIGSASVGIGTAGIGAAGTAIKTTPGSATLAISPGTAGNGGSTTFGTFLTVYGGNGGDSSGTGAGSATKGLAGSATTTVYGAITAAGARGGEGAITNVSAGSAGLPGDAGLFTVIPNWGTLSAPGTGLNSVTTTGSVLGTALGASGTAGLSSLTGSGAGGGGGRGGSTYRTSSAGGAGAGGSGSGAGGITIWGTALTAITYTVTSNGGTAAANSGAGGGGGGGVAIEYTNTAWNLSTGTIISRGGDGGGGRLFVLYTL